METTFEITNDKGNKFLVRIVRKGDRYGRNDCLVNQENKALVEVYDAEYIHTQFGQFISRYYMETLLDGSSRNNGINLYGGEPKWQIDAQNWRKVIVWLMVQKELDQDLVDVLSAKAVGKAVNVWEANQ